MVAEADLEAETDHACMAHALQRRASATDVSLDTMIGLYVSIMKRSHKLTSRSRWVLELDATGRRPPSFPDRLLWDSCRGKRCTSRRDLWLATLERARSFLRGELPDPCHADHWGSRVLAADVRRAKRAVREGRWAPAEPSGETVTVNAFYRTTKGHTR